MMYYVTLAKFVLGVFTLSLQRHYHWLVWDAPQMVYYIYIPIYIYIYTYIHTDC